MGKGRKETRAPSWADGPVKGTKQAFASIIPEPSRLLLEGEKTTIRGGPVGVTEEDSRADGADGANDTVGQKTMKLHEAQPAVSAQL